VCQVKNLASENYGSGLGFAVACYLALSRPLSKWREPLDMGMEYTRRALGLDREDLPEEQPRAEVDRSGAQPKSAEEERSTTVMVVHGRDSKLKDSIFAFLRALKLNPLEWEAGVRKTGIATPYVGEVLTAVFHSAQAVVVILSGDDEGRLREDLLHDADGEHEKQLTPQARPNVIFEAGLAFGTHPTQTILVEVGRLRPFSDIGGRHVIRFDGSEQKRRDLADRLAIAGCRVDLTTDEYITLELPYDFNAIAKAPRDIPPPIAPDLSATQVRVEPAQEVGWLSFGPTLIDEIGTFYGGSGRADNIPAAHRIFDEDDDEHIKALVRRIPGCSNLDSATVPEGIVIGDHENFNPQNFPLSRHAVFVSSQSRVVVRFVPEGAHVLYDLSRSLAAPYYIARGLVRRFDASPLYHFGFGYRIGEGDPKGMLPGPTYQDYFAADVGAPFAESALGPVLKCLRGGSMGTQKRDDIRNSLKRFWTEHFGEI
jgi:predicted nucleotide-binding protein